MIDAFRRHRGYNNSGKKSERGPLLISISLAVVIFDTISKWAVLLEMIMRQKVERFFVAMAYSLSDGRDILLHFIYDHNDNLEKKMN